MWGIKLPPSVPMRSIVSDLLATERHPPKRIYPSRRHGVPSWAYVNPSDYSETTQLSENWSAGTAGISATVPSMMIDSLL